MIKLIAAFLLYLFVESNELNHEHRLLQSVGVNSPFCDFRGRDAIVVDTLKTYEITANLWGNTYDKIGFSWSCTSNVASNPCPAFDKSQSSFRVQANSLQQNTFYNLVLTVGSVNTTNCSIQLQTMTAA